MPEPTPNESYIRIDGDVKRGIILIADHARNTLPTRYGMLGLAPAQFSRHIAYDIGVEQVTQGLARALGCPAFLTLFSRLLIDANRGIDDPTLIMRISDGAVIPGNAHVDEAERMDRINRFHMPYHSALRREIDGALASGIVPVLFSVHSFTPRWRDVPRPWHVGVLWDEDRRFSDSLIAGLSRMGDLIVGDNEPYSGALEGDTLNVHGTRRGLAHALIEIRQDLIADQTGVDEWIERLVRVLEPILNEPQLHRPMPGEVCHDSRPENRE
jgi:predicted N-formylglutamate amidohydrolase